MSKILVDKDVLEQALEALEQSETFVPYEGFGMARREAERKHQAAITALRAALAEPVQAPHMYPLQSDRMRIDPVTGDVSIGTTSAEPVQEPVFEIGFGWLDDATKYPKGTKLYIAPLQRKPLTEEEIRQIAIDTPNTPKAFARAIERAHEICE